MPSVFKKCSCDRRWVSRNSFLADPQIELTGYMPDFEELKLGLILFLHKKPGCFTTIAIQADEVRDLHNGPVFRKRVSPKDGCPGYCLKKEMLGVCTKKCSCRWVREVLEVIRYWKKTKERAAG